MKSTPSRREFLTTSALAGALWASAPLDSCRSFAQEADAAAAKQLNIEIAGYDLDRVRGLIDGRVQVDRCGTKFEIGRIGEMNTHVFSGPRTREATEIGLLPFILAFANEDFRAYSLLPVFPLRVFRHKSIFIRTDRGITKPQDLRGKKIATPGYSSTSLTWIRGIMQHEYGVKPEEIQWVVSAKDSSAKATGGASKLENIFPKGLSIATGPTGKDESDLLVDGDVDALFHAAEPRAFQQGHPKVARLFADSRATERAYFKETGIFPIMHAVAVRNDVIKAHPWFPKALFDAYCQAKQIAYDELKKRAWYETSLPWIAQEVEETRKLMGDNYWPYGMKRNRKALATLLQYSYEQGLAKRRVEVDELFHPSPLSFTETKS